jgi:hypothetical protein
MSRVGSSERVADLAGHRRAHLCEPRVAVGLCHLLPRV